MGGTCWMLNLRTEWIILSCDIILTNKTYGKYLSRWEHTKAGIYMIKYEEKSDN